MVDQKKKFTSMGYNLNQRNKTNFRSLSNFRKNVIGKTLKEAKAAASRLCSMKVFFKFNRKKYNTLKLNTSDKRKP